MESMMKTNLMRKTRQMAHKLLFKLYKANEKMLFKKQNIPESCIHRLSLTRI